MFLIHLKMGGSLLDFLESPIPVLPVSLELKDRWRWDGRMYYHRKWSNMKVNERKFIRKVAVNPWKLSPGSVSQRMCRRSRCKGGGEKRDAPFSKLEGVSDLAVTYRSLKIFIYC